MKGLRERWDYLVAGSNGGEIDARTALQRSKESDDNSITEAKLKSSLWDSILEGRKNM